MHVLFVHRTFPGQFEHIARYLASRPEHRCTYVSEAPSTEEEGIRNIHYDVPVEADRPSSYLTQDVDEEIGHAAGVYDALKPLQGSIRPDLIVGHTGWGSTLLLPELYPGVPVIDYFEYFHVPHRSAIDFRHDFPPPRRFSLRQRVLNATRMLHLEYCSAGYTPTNFQLALLPERYRSKVRVIHDGIDTEFWRRSVEPVRSSDDTRIITYVSRGLESIRGFDIFMRAAKLIYQVYPNVVFLVAGWDTVEYGPDMALIEEKSFKEHVLNQDDYDLERIRFLGPIPRESLLRVFTLSDLHIYLTVPFVLSWSLLQAMSCGCTVLASDTEPAREVVVHGQNGLLCDFFDAEGLAEAAVGVLRDPAGHRELGRAAARTVRDRYALDVVVPEMMSFYLEVAERR
jgi:glycosyltransferase involved in cell wall biosynthesis